MTRGVIVKLSCSAVIAGSIIWFAYSIGCRLDQGLIERQHPLLDMDEYPQLLLKRSLFTRTIGSLGYTFLRQSKSGEILPSWIARGYTSWVIGDHIQRPAVKLSFRYSGGIDDATFYISKEDLESKRYVR